MGFRNCFLCAPCERYFTVEAEVVLSSQLCPDCGKAEGVLSVAPWDALFAALAGRPAGAGKAATGWCASLDNDVWPVVLVQDKRTPRLDVTELVVIGPGNYLKLSKENLLAMSCALRALADRYEKDALAATSHQ